MNAIYHALRHRYAPECVETLRVNKAGGRWVAVYWIGDVRVPSLKRGLRVRSLSHARRLARERNGIVQRYHAKNWRQAPAAAVRSYWMPLDDDIAFALAADAFAEATASL